MKQLLPLLATLQLGTPAVRHFELSFETMPTLTGKAAAFNGYVITSMRIEHPETYLASLHPVPTETPRERHRYAKAFKLGVRFLNSDYVVLNYCPTNGKVSSVELVYADDGDLMQSNALIAMMQKRLRHPAYKYFEGADTLITHTEWRFADQSKISIGSMVGSNDLQVEFSGKPEDVACHFSAELMGQ